MFVGVSRLVLQIPESGSLKAKRQILRRVTDRVKARFNAAVAEVEDNDLWQKATIAIAVIGNDRGHVDEQLGKIIHFVDEMYVAPLISRATEILSLGDELYGNEGEPSLPLETGQRSLAEAEGLGDWDKRHTKAPEEPRPAKVRGAGKQPKSLSFDEARAKARSLRNPRDWEKK